MSGRPNQPQSSSARGGSDATGGNLLAEMRGGDTIGGEAPPPPPPRARRRLKTQNIVIGAVIVLSVGVLYAMRLYGMGAGISFATVPIDYQIDGQSARLTAEQRRILQELQLSGEPIRLAMSHIRKNPFQLNTRESSVLGPEVPLDPNADDADLERQEALERQIAQAMGNLTLNSVMRGRIPIARVNGKIVKVGDTIDGVFTVKAIHDREVELEAPGGKVFALTMGEADGDSGKP
jgi:hypothetical protein